MKKLHDDYTEYFFTNWLVKQASRPLHCIKKRVTLFYKLCFFVRRYISWDFGEIGTMTMGSIICKILGNSLRVSSEIIQQMYAFLPMYSQQFKKGIYLFHF